MWIIYVYVCLRGLRLSERSSQNAEPHYDRMSFGDFSEAHQPQKYVLTTEAWLKWCFFFTLLNFWFSFFVFKLRRQRELVTKTWTVRLSLLFPHFFFLLCVFLPALFVSLWSLLWKWGGAEAQAYFSLSSASLSCHPSSSSPGWKQVWPFILSWRVEHYSWAMFGHRISFMRFLAALEGPRCTHYPGFVVTKNPHSPRVWSAGVSSKVGRGGSRSTSQSSLCLDLGNETEKVWITH